MNPYRFQYRLFGAQKEVVIQQSFEFGIGGVLWDCELILTKYVTHPTHQGRWNNATVVELGSGTAMASIACWQMGGKVIATDLPEVASVITKTNVSLNTTSGNKQQRKNCGVMPLSWGVEAEGEELLKAVRSSTSSAPPTGAGAKGAQPATSSSTPVIDFIIAADVVYRSEDHEKLLSSLLQLADPERTTIIFVHRERFSNDSNFIQPLKSCFKQIAATNAKAILPTYPKENATIYEFRGRLAEGTTAEADLCQE